MSPCPKNLVQLRGGRIFDVLDDHNDTPILRSTLPSVCLLEDEFLLVEISPCEPTVVGDGPNDTRVGELVPITCGDREMSKEPALVLGPREDELDGSNKHHMLGVVSWGIGGVVGRVPVLFLGSVVSESSEGFFDVGAEDEDSHGSSLGRG